MARFARTGTTLGPAALPIIQVLETLVGQSATYIFKRFTVSCGRKSQNRFQLRDFWPGDLQTLDLVPNMY